MIEELLSGTKALSEIVAANVAFDLKQDEIDMLDAAGREESAAFDAVAEVFNHRTLTGWTSTGHTGIDVPLYATGPGSSHFHGVMQNEDVGRVMKEVFLPE